MDLRSFATAQSPDEERWRPYFLAALGAVGLSVVALLAFASAAACKGSDAPPAAATLPSETSAPTLAPTETPLPTATQPAADPTAAPVQPTPAPGEDTSTLVPCGLLSPVDQTHRVSRDCVAGPLTTVEGYSLIAEAADAYRRMAADAANEGITLVIISAYRDFDTQAALYRNEVAQFGPNQNTSAKPGHSEHQLGTTIDLNDLSTAFGQTAAGRWLAANSMRYGFVLSYPAGREAQTGYAYEPWHFRYVGVATAQAYIGSGTSLNRFLGGGQ